MSDAKKQPTFADGLFAMAVALSRVNAWVYNQPGKCTCQNNDDLCQFCQEREQDADRKEVECIRCNEWPCVCGDVGFESWNSAELRKAEERD